MRLAAKLTGWRIDIKSEEEKRREVEAQFEGLETGAAEPEPESSEEGTPEGATEAPAAEAVETSDAPLPYTLGGIGDKTVRKLVDAGLATLEEVREASVERLSEIPGIGGKTAEKILAAARGGTEAAPEATGDSTTE